jgi:hypothetical protein
VEETKRILAGTSFQINLQGSDVGSWPFTSFRSTSAIGAASDMLNWGIGIVVLTQQRRVY